jgi:hypothetical protein
MPNSFANDGAQGAGQNTNTAPAPADVFGRPPEFSAGGDPQVGFAAGEISAPQYYSAAGYTPSAVGLAFSQGGAIPDDTNGSPQQDAISKALESVDQVLAFGRKLHGLGGGSNEGAIQTAGADQRLPGDQGSWEGPMSPTKPSPAPQPINPFPQLPPGNNPFGKRADAGGDNDSDDQAGAIDTDEDAA